MPTTKKRSFLILSFLLVLFPVLLMAEPIAIFVPPTDWECVIPNRKKNPHQLPPSIKIGFLKKTSSSFRPSINLTQERVSVSLKEYLRSVRTLHETELEAQWHDLGEFVCRAGTGRLAEIHSRSPSGELTMLQAIILRDGWAYILTGAAEKSTFHEERSLILNALHSLDVIPDLFSAISNMNERIALKTYYDSLSIATNEEARNALWKGLAERLSSYEDLGLYWLFLALKEGRERIYTQGD